VLIRVNSGSKFNISYLSQPHVKENPQRPKPIPFVPEPYPELVEGLVEAFTLPLFPSSLDNTK